MSIIGQLISNIHQYGNSKFYVQGPNLLSALAIEFFVDEKGALNVTQILERYDSPFWDGERKNENAILEETIEVVKYSEKDFSVVISTIVFSSFYKEGRVALTHEETPNKINTDLVVEKLYQMVYAMLQLSNADLTKWVLMTENGIENQLINKISQNIISEKFSSEQAIENIEAMRKEVNNRLADIENVWKKTQTIYSEEEYETACKQWEILYDDNTIPKLSHTKKYNEYK